MPARIPNVIRNGVIDSWLLGDSTSIIALKNHVSEGSVTNIVEEFRHAVGPERADLLRNLAVAVSKTGITVYQCAQGHRLVMIMKRMGIEREDDYENFLTKISKQYVEAGLDPGRLFEQINELNFFLERNQGPQGRTSIPQIEGAIEAKKEQEKRLDKRISLLESQEKDLEKNLSQLKFNKAKAESDLEWDLELREKIDKNHLTNVDVSKVIRAATLMKERGYDIFQIMERLSKFEEIENACLSIERSKVDAELRLDQLLRDSQALQERLSQNSLKLQELDSLQALGFGHAEFRMLRDIITEVGEESGLIGNKAVKKFFEDLRNYYYDYVCLRKRVSELKAEKAQLSSKGTTDYATNLIQDLLKLYAKTPGESNPKNNSTKEDSRTEKNVESDSVNGATSAQKANDETLNDISPDTPDSSPRHQERGNPSKMFYDEQMKSHSLDRLRRNDSIPSDTLSKTRPQPVSDEDEPWPITTEMLNSQTNDILETMFGDRAKEPTKRLRNRQ